MYSVSDFDYHLPLELIAQKPIRPRDHSRLLLLNKKTGALEHRYFYDLVDYLKPGDLLVLNNSKVFPARLIGQKKETGGAVEVFLHHKLSKNVWECLLKGKINEGLVIKFTNKFFQGLEAKVVENNNDGTWQVKFNLSGQKFWSVINKIGQVPLPPYIKRNSQLVSDKNSYQTVFADNHRVGSVAAPTAGFHFTKSLLKKIRARGVKIRYVTLHVGLGTFAPVKTEKIREHKMHRELAAVSSKTIRDILNTKKAGGRVIAVGTTSCRTLESANLEKPADQTFWTDIFIYPGYKFKVVDALITNFHLPKSTLLMLVSALADKPAIDRAYQEAISEKYRFFSYGDAMFIY
ncbi:MAG: tRNA preQ1(34) S-adenosylmethionine ribosyltransferase-isomerase QueA [Patescibacteria group bacterium]